MVSECLLTVGAQFGARCVRLRQSLSRYPGKRRRKAARKDGLDLGPPGRGHAWERVPLLARLFPRPPAFALPSGQRARRLCSTLAPRPPPPLPPLPHSPLCTISLHSLSPRRAPSLLHPLLSPAPLPPLPIHARPIQQHGARLRSAEGAAHHASHASARHAWRPRLSTRLTRPRGLLSARAPLSLVCACAAGHHAGSTRAGPGALAGRVRHVQAHLSGPARRPIHGARPRLQRHVAVQGRCEMA